MIAEFEQPPMSYLYFKCLSTVARLILHSLQMIQFKMNHFVVGIFATVFLLSVVYGQESPANGDCALEVRVVTFHIICISCFSFSDSHVPT